jgi:hypothetical protein
MKRACVSSACRRLLTVFTCPEQKRRQAIREGFDRLTELVPGLEGQGRSEGVVLQRSVAYMREQLSARRDLIQRVESYGATVDEALKKSVFITSTRTNLAWRNQANHVQKTGQRQSERSPA